MTYSSCSASVGSTASPRRAGPIAAEAGSFRLDREALDLLTDQPTNVFIIKANFWLSL